MPRRTSGGTASAKKTKKQASLDALAMLKNDHRKVEQLFEDVLNNHKQETAAEIFKELEIHAMLEEELFYPALQKDADREELAAFEQGDEEDEALDRAEMEDHENGEGDEEEETAEEIGEDVIASAYEDHQSVKELIQRLKSLDPGSADFHQGMVELHEMVRDHVAEEEEVIFPEAKLKLDIKGLAAQMQERKQELMSSMSA